MEKTIEGDFYNDINTTKSIRIRGNLVSQLGQVGTEGSVGFYDIDIVQRQTYLPTKLPVCIKEITIDTNRFPECSANETLRKYLLFKSIGLPVVSFLRSDGKNRILMPDVTNRGKKEIIDSHLTRPDNLEINNIREIKSEAYRSANVASEYGIFLYQDAYAVAVDKQSREGKLLLLDIGRKTLIGGDSYGQEDLFNEVYQFIDFVL